MNWLPPPHWIWALAVAPFVGSFAALLADRIPLGRGWVWGRSKCQSCDHVLAVRDLIPVIGWLLLHGRCRHCGATISKIHLVADLLAICLAISAITIFDGWLLWASCVFAWSLLTLAMMDAKYFILTDVITLPLIPAGLVLAYAIDEAKLVDHVIGAVVGFAVFYVIAAIYRLMRGRDGLGLGDAKLLAVAGAWVGWNGLATVVLWAGLSGLVTVVTVAVLSGRAIEGQKPFAFGPFLCSGIWLVWLYGPVSLVY